MNDLKGIMTIVPSLDSKSEKVHLGSLKPEQFQEYVVETFEALRGKPFTEVELLTLRLSAKKSIVDVLFALKQLALNDNAEPTEEEVSENATEVVE